MCGNNCKTIHTLLSLTMPLSNTNQQGAYWSSGYHQKSHARRFKTTQTQRQPKSCPVSFMLVSSLLSGSGDRSHGNMRELLFSARCWMITVLMPGPPDFCLAVWLEPGYQIFIFIVKEIQKGANRTEEQPFLLTLAICICFAYYMRLMTIPSLSSH